MAEYIVDARPSDLFGIKMTGLLVRCKDCKHGRQYAADCVSCEYEELAKDPEWFCAGGERKDGDGD